MHRLPPLMPPDYPNPPVHEVVVSLAFDAAADQLDGFAARAGEEAWPPELGTRVSLDDATIVGRAAPGGGGPIWQARTAPSGLAVSDRLGADASRALQLRPELASYHLIRPSSSPEGRYAGWDAVAVGLRALRPGLERLYGEAPIIRLALRYLNRIAVPAGESLDRWLAVGVYGPPGVNAPATFSVHLQWERLDAAPEFGASLVLYPITLSEIGRDGKTVGLQLDLEVSRFRADGSMIWATLEDWVARAHAAHGALFEACVTDALRARFHSAPASGATSTGDQ